jgi:hypothetical protein
MLLNKKEEEVYLYINLLYTRFCIGICVGGWECFTKESRLGEKHLSGFQKIKATFFKSSSLLTNAMGNKNASFTNLARIIKDHF